MRIGYKLAAEAFGPAELIRQAVLAEQAGFDFVEMSDHYHPWLEAQGHSAFTWSVLPVIAAKTDADRPGHRRDLPVGAVPPGDHRPGGGHHGPGLRRPVHAGRRRRASGSTSTSSAAASPASAMRHERFREALEIIRLLWRGGYRSYEGKHLQLEDARVFDLPDELPVIAVAASGPESARIAAELGDGLFATEPDGDLVSSWHEPGRQRTRLRRDAPGLGGRRGQGRAGGPGEEPVRADRLEGHGRVAQPGQLRGRDREHHR